MLKLLAITLLAPAIYAQCQNCQNTYGSTGYGTNYYNPSSGYSNQQYGNMPCCSTGSSNYNSNSRYYNPSSYSNGYNTQSGNSYGNKSPTRFYNDLIGTNLGYPSSYGISNYNNQNNRMYDSTGYGNNQYGASGCCSSVSSSCCYQSGTSGSVYYDPNMRSNTYSTTSSPYGYSSTTSYPYTSGSGYSNYNLYGKK